MNNDRTMVVKLGEGRHVPDPERGDDLPADESRTVPRNQYWLRALNSGDVVAADGAAVTETGVKAKAGKGAVQ